MYVAKCWPGGHAHIPLGFQNGENFLHGIIIFSVGDATATVPASSGTCPLSQLDGSTGRHGFFWFPDGGMVGLISMPGTHQASGTPCLKSRLT